MPEKRTKFESALLLCPAVKKIKHPAMQDFPLHGVYIDRNINNKYRNENNENQETRLCDACCHALPRLLQQR